MFQYFICKLALAIALAALAYNKDKLFVLENSKTLIIKKSPDFDISGEGSSENWTKTEWLELPQRAGESLTTKVKALYSGTGMYFLFNCQDKKLTSTMDADFMDLWKEDVVEVFLWTDQDPSYFEYEISPLNYE